MEYMESKMQDQIEGAIHAQGESIRNGNDCAFPMMDHSPSTGPNFYYGLTKREYFAIQIMAGLASDPNFNTASGTSAEISVRGADALLAELAK